MNRLVRNRFAVGAVGVLAFSLAATPLVATADQNDLTRDDNVLQGIVTAGDYVGRISGIDRFGTAVAASKNLTDAQERREDVTEYVIIANYLGWSDTLTATPLADVLDAPVLYSYADRLGDTTAEELERLEALGVNNVILVGGEGVLQPALKSEIRSLGFDITNIDRVGGLDRYETGLNLAIEAVDYYEDGDADLAPLREAIRALDRAEAAFHAALAAWESSRAVSEAAFADVLAAQAELDEANEELAELLEQVVEIPGVEVTDPTTGATIHIDDLEDYNNLVVTANQAVEESTTVEAWVQDRIAEFVAHYGAGYQDAEWNDEVVPFFGSQVFTLELHSGTFTGTLEQLSTSGQGPDTLVWAVNSEGDTTTVAAVDMHIAEQVEFWEDWADDLRAIYSLIVAQIVDRADAIEHNEQLQREIRDLQRLIEDLVDARDDAVDAYFAARAVEADAKVAFEEATEDRPKGDAWAHAELLLETEFDRLVRAGRAFPGFYATGLDFADALAAGPAAASEAGVVLLTRGDVVPPSTQRYLDNNSNVVAVGGPAAAAVDAQVEYVGSDRYETARLLANAYFNGEEAYVGMASGLVAADAVVGGAFMANVDGTLVLTRDTSLPQTTHDFLAYDVDRPQLLIFGGPGAISHDVRDEAREALVG